jgi:hypothetical protein
VSVKRLAIGLTTSALMVAIAYLLFSYSQEVDQKLDAGTLQAIELTNRASASKTEERIVLIAESGNKAVGILSEGQRIWILLTPRDGGNDVTKIADNSGDYELTPEEYERIINFSGSQDEAVAQELASHVRRRPDSQGQ